MKFKDLLAVACIIVVIPCIWITQGYGFINLSPEVIGATIMAWGSIIAHYFEKE